MLQHPHLLGLRLGSQPLPLCEQEEDGAAEDKVTLLTRLHTAHPELLLRSAPSAAASEITGGMSEMAIGGR